MALMKVEGMPEGTYVASIDDLRAGEPIVVEGKRVRITGAGGTGPGIPYDKIMSGKYFVVEEVDR